MMRTLVVALGLACSFATAQYIDDYPVSDLEYAHHRLVYSPLRLIGGMNATKRDEGPKVDLLWTPGLDLQELRYEYVVGPQGSLGFGPIVNAYLGQDSVKATAVAAGVYSRLYAGIGSGSYVQGSLQYYMQMGTKVRDGFARDAQGNVHVADVEVSGPQFSPVLGYQKIFLRHWAMELQAGFTVGYYNVKVKAPGDTLAATEQLETEFGPIQQTKVYRSGSDWGGFYFMQVALGYAW